MQCGFHPSRATMDVILLQRKMQALQWITFHDIFLNLKTSLTPSIKRNCVNSSKTWLSFEIPFHITFLECYATMILTDVSTIDPIPLQIDLNAVSFFSVQCCTLPQLPGGWSKFSAIQATEPFSCTPQMTLVYVHVQWPSPKSLLTHSLKPMGKIDLLLVQNKSNLPTCQLKITTWGLLYPGLSLQLVSLEWMELAEDRFSWLCGHWKEQR